MSNIAYRVSHNKRKPVLQWLQSLCPSENISWPIHSMSVNEWFRLFCQMHPPTRFGLDTFHDTKYFNLQMNSIVHMNLFPGLTKEVKRYPTYSVNYTLRDAEVFDTSSEPNNNGK